MILRLPRLRVTVRGMMILVAVVAVVLGAGLGLKRREADLTRQGREHMQQWASYTNEFSKAPAQRMLPDAMLSRRAAWHGTMWRKYERASHRAWAPVAADPPKPSPW